MEKTLRLYLLTITSDLSKALIFIKQYVEVITAMFFEPSAGLISSKYILCKFPSFVIFLSFKLYPPDPLGFDMYKKLKTCIQHQIVEN